MSKIVTLPPPPPKRRRLAPPIATNQQEPAETPAGHADTASFEHDFAAEPAAPEALPNDALVALQLLNSRFPAVVSPDVPPWTLPPPPAAAACLYTIAAVPTPPPALALQAGVAPFATCAQLYSVLADRTAADRQLEELRRSNTVRLLQLPASRDECVVMLTADYVAAVQRCKEELAARSQQQQQQQQQPHGGGGGGDRNAAGHAAGALEAFAWFAERVLPACTEVMVTHGELLQLLSGAPPARWVSGPGAACCPAGCTTWLEVHSPLACLPACGTQITTAEPFNLRCDNHSADNDLAWPCFARLPARVAACVSGPAHTQTPTPPYILFFLTTCLASLEAHPAGSLSPSPACGHPAWCRPGQPRRQADAAGAAAGEPHVSLLLSQGLLTRHTGGPDGYLFSMPNAGAAVRSVAGGQRRWGWGLLGPGEAAGQAVHGASLLLDRALQPTPSQRTQTLDTPFRSPCARLPRSRPPGDSVPAAAPPPA